MEGRGAMSGVDVAATACCGASNSSSKCGRWNPTAEQVRVLTELFRSGLRTPTTEQIQSISSYLSAFGRIESKNVFYWFQNHKARERHHHHGSHHGHHNQHCKKRRRQHEAQEVVIGTAAAASPASSPPPPLAVLHGHDDSSSRQQWYCVDSSSQNRHVLSLWKDVGSASEYSSSAGLCSLQGRDHVPTLDLFPVVKEPAVRILRNDYRDSAKVYLAPTKDLVLELRLSSL